MQTSSWEKDGHKFYKTEIVAERWHSVESKSGGAEREEYTPPVRTDKTPTKAEQVDRGQPEYPDSDIKPEDIPF